MSAHRPVDVGEIDSLRLERRAGRVGAVDRVLDVLDPLLGPVHEQHVVRHDAIPSSGRVSRRGRAYTRRVVAAIEAAYATVRGAIAASPEVPARASGRARPPRPRLRSGARSGRGAPPEVDLAKPTGRSIQCPREDSNLRHT